MEIEIILRQLAHPAKTFPRQAVEQALNRHDEVTPHLLAILEYTNDNIEKIAEMPGYMGHIFAMYILAQFREVRAYPLIVRFYSNPGDIPYNLTGDVITEDLHRILASVYDNDLAPIKSLIENEELDEFVRSAAIHSLLCLVAGGRCEPDEIASYFRELFLGYMGTQESYALESLIMNGCRLWGAEMLPEVRKKFAGMDIDPFSCRLENMEKLLAVPLTEKLAALQKNHDMQLINDVIALLQNWACFHPNRGAYYPGKKQGTIRQEITAGRNDPCPCGSGKKYKKCCLN